MAGSRASGVRARRLGAATLAAILIAASGHAQSPSPRAPPPPGIGAHWRADAPGVIHRITLPLPAPYATQSQSNNPRVVARPADALPRVPPGFTVELWAEGFRMPRQIRRAPNGDIFLAESGAGQIRVFPAAETGPNPRGEVFAAELTLPFGIAFWPPADPSYVYVANTDSVVRFPYRSGDVKARGPAETVVGDLPNGGHWTRDLAATPDGVRLYLSVGSLSNAATSMPASPPSPLPRWEAMHGLGAAWGEEAGRASVFTLDPRTGARTTFATGMRNCVSLALQPGTNAPWCVTNERDGLGDDLPPDYATRVAQGAFYGWPWYYIGDHEDPRLKGRRPDLAGKSIVPDVLIASHSAPLGITFYDGANFPPEYRGDAFVTLHGSWNRGRRTGYKLVRVRFADGQPTGAYEDFMTGFVISDTSVWGRPVGVAVAADGSLLVTEDGNNTIWRIAYRR